MDNNTHAVLNQFFGAEIQYFYNHYAKEDPKRKIEIVLAAESIYEAIMHQNISKIQKSIIEKQGKRVTDNLNGLVILCKDISRDGIKVLFSLQAIGDYLSKDDYFTPLGTIIHEFTHANDFIDFAEYLGETDSEVVMSNEYWFTVQMWSEFHARRNGFLRVLNAATNETLSFPEDYYEHEIELIRTRWKKQLEENELYELMQLCGRYSVIEEVFSDKTSGFNNDLLKGVYSGAKLFVGNQIYRFCKDHQSFEVFVNDMDDLKSLIT